MAGTQFNYDCPHCSTRSAGFTVVYQWGDRQSPSVANVLSICGVCNLGLLLKSRDTSIPHAHLIQYQIDFPGSRFTIDDVWPSPGTGLPSHLPDNIAAFFSQGLENFRAKRWDAAGAMFRKSLDVATKTLDPELRKLPLYGRIEKLHGRGLLTDSIRDWSHEIRLDGNEAVHDEIPETPEDASASYRFTEAFLTYTFTLPNMVRENREKRDAQS